MQSIYVPCPLITDQRTFRLVISEMFRKGAFEPSRIIGEFAGALAMWMVLMKGLAQVGSFRGLRRIGTGNQSIECSIHRNSAMAQVHRMNL
jgi:hypothetical protein